MVFMIIDGIGIIWVVVFEVFGVRVYLNINVGDIVEVIGKVVFYLGEI